ncbi:MAG: hypothetical protein M0009_17215 [Deltaproteobacteria bacterium]|nr:hypothetical protein [Deltaproteobacteria bacterium]
MSAYFEKQGIPAVVEVADLPNVKKIAQDTFLTEAVPAMRAVFIPPVRWTEKVAEQDLPKFLEALTKPLTDAEKKSGKYLPPAAPRIAMTGTYDEIQDFFTGDLSVFVDTPPTAKWTDGLPVTPPTAEAVARMLKGTSHKPDEIVHPAVGPQKRPVTVEKVAINAVMAGCKPEQLPVVLAITQGGLTAPFSSAAAFGFFNIVSGPIVKEIGMNTSVALMSPGNPANAAISRFTALALRNLSGYTPGINNITGYGSTFTGLTIAESPDTPWEGLNVRYGASAKESVILQLSGKVSAHGHGIGETTIISDKPEAPQRLISAAKAYVPTAGTFGKVFIVTPNIARKWKAKFGWDSMAKLQDYLWDNATWPRKNYDLSYWWGTRAPFKAAVEALKAPRGSRVLNMDHFDAAPDTLVPINPSPLFFPIVVAGGGVPDYHDLQNEFGWGVFGGYTVLSIDKWK